jgi:hypothetical protein
MTLNRFPILFLICTSLVASSVAAQTSATDAIEGQTSPKNAPVVQECWPHSGAVNSIIELKGLRLGPGDPEPAKAFVIQNGIEIPARTGGGSAVTNDRQNAQQTLEVILPEEVVPGPAQIVAERNGFRTAPVTITITEWTLPVIKQITPTTGPPGTFVYIECDNFHIYDEIELTDGEGRTVKSFESGGSALGTSFDVPKDFPEGVLRIRIGNRKRGKNQFTPPVEFVVTNEALPVEIIPQWMQSVAPGQWLGLVASSLAPLKHSEQTEVSFKQAGREIIVNLPRPGRPRVEVPAALSPGEVQIQVRTWRNGRPSAWSIAGILNLAEKPLPPYVHALRIEKGTSVSLSPGPDRATKFTAAPGDLILINGTYPVAGPDKLKVLLVKLGEIVELPVTELDGRADWFNEISVRLPADIGRGNWQMIVRASDGTEHHVPIPIHISSK